MKSLLLILLSLSLSAMDLVETLKKEEGFRSNVYLCTAKKWTIGYGHRCDANQAPITKAQAEKILDNDIKIAKAGTEKLIGKEAPEEVKKIVIAMVFQMGFEGVKKFTKTIKYIKNGDYLSSSKEMLDSEWYRNEKTRARCERMSALMAEIK